MGTFAAGHFLDPRTGRPVAAQTVRVLEYPTDVPVTPDGGPLTTGALGGYERFVVADVDAVTLVGPGNARVDLVSIEKQMAAADSGTSEPVLAPLTVGSGASFEHDGRMWTQHTSAPDGVPTTSRVMNSTTGVRFGLGVPGTNPSQATTERNEFSGGSYELAPGVDRYVGMTFRWSGVAPTPTGVAADGWCLIAQYLAVGASTGGPPVLVFIDSDGYLNVTTRTNTTAAPNSTVRARVPVTPREWHRMVLRVKMSPTGPDGVIQVWLDGVLALNHANIWLGFSDAPRVYPKFGLYRNASTGRTWLDVDDIHWSPTALPTALSLPRLAWPDPAPEGFALADQFTAANGTTLAGRVVNGHTWQAPTALFGGGAVAVISDNKATATGGTTREGACIEVGTPRLRLTCRFVLPAGSTASSFVGFGTALGNLAALDGLVVQFVNGYGFVVKHGTGGAAAQIGGIYAAAGTDAVSALINMEWDGTTATVRINNDLHVSAPVSGLTGTKAGFWLVPSLAGASVDNFIVHTL